MKKEQSYVFSVLVLASNYLFFRVPGMVSLFVDSPLVESAVDVDDIAMDGALSLSTHWVFQSQSLISKRLLSFWLKSN